MSDLPCGHDERFRVFDAVNGCLACQCELEAKEKVEARKEAKRLRETAESYEKQLIQISNILGGDARDAKGSDKSIAGLMAEEHEAVERLKAHLLSIADQWPATSGHPCDIAIMLLSTPKPSGSEIVQKLRRYENSSPDDHVLDTMLAAADEIDRLLDTEALIKQVTETAINKMWNYPICTGGVNISTTVPADCSHVWTDARSTSVDSGMICTKCGELRPAGWSVGP